jgi:1-hydroxycarotenoid 3,4-desaturase
VIAIDNLITGNERNLDHLRGNSKFRFLRHDVTQFIAVEGPIDYVFHFASPASPIDYLQMPIQTLKVGAHGTHNCLGLAKEKGARILVASTSEVYGDPLEHPQTETYWGNVNPVGPRGVYDEAKRFMEFCKQARAVYDALEGPFIRSQSPTLTSMSGDLGLRGLAVLAALGPMSNLWDALRQHFHDIRLQQLFGRYATYCGSSPWQAPATLMLVTQVELDGVWAVKGGMHALAKTLARLAEAKGVKIRYSSPCASIATEGQCVSGVTLADGEFIAADSVVFNGDASALGQGLLGQQVKRAVPALAVSKRSLSAVTWSVHAETEGFPLDRHNVFFQPDYQREFSDIFSRGRLPQTPTVYVCAQDRGLDEAAPERDRLLVLVNAPAEGGRHLTESEIDACEHHSFSLLARYGLTIKRTQHNSLRTIPSDFHRMFPGSGGALYGMATHGWMSAFARSGASTRIPGLYLAGGSVHPGPGVPMAAMSGQLAAATLMGHLDSTSKSRRVVISGGMSTRSATTATMD